MSEMIERVASAIERETWAITAIRLRGGTVTTQEQRVRQAKVAIEAMREPTEIMLMSGSGSAVPDPTSQGGFYYPHSRKELPSAWRAMIDAALDDQG